MTTVETISTALHLLVGAAWAGGVVFVSLAVLPAVRSGDVDPRPLSVVTGRLKLLSRTSAVVMLLTGGHLAGTLYDAASLTGTTRGWLVLAMVALWLALAALVEVAADQLAKTVEESDAATAARETTPLFYAAATAGVFLLLVGGYLAG